MVIVTGIDIETTGLSQEKGHRIIEIAAVMYDLDTRKELLRWVQRINPQRSIDAGAQAVHGISFEDLTSCPTWAEVAPKVVKILGKSALVVAHNGDGFDMPFIGNELIRIGQPIPNIQTFDTMLRFRWATPLGKMPSLKELCFACGVEYDEHLAHAALYDVRVMMDSFFFAKNKGFVSLTET